MSARTRGIAVAAIQLLIVLSLGGKLLYDRMTRPRAWVLVNTYDPELPIRGRYLTEQLRMPGEGFTFRTPKELPNSDSDFSGHWAYYTVRDGNLIANATGSDSQPGGSVSLQKKSDGTIEADTLEPVLFFIPATANLPRIERGDELWMEVTLPKKGPPRPIRLAIKKNGVLTPLSYN